MSSVLRMFAICSVYASTAGERSTSRCTFLRLLMRRTYTGTNSGGMVWVASTDFMETLSMSGEKGADLRSRMVCSVLFTCSWKSWSWRMAAKRESDWRLICSFRHTSTRSRYPESYVGRVGVTVTL